MLSGILSEGVLVPYARGTRLWDMIKNCSKRFIKELEGKVCDLPRCSNYCGHDFSMFLGFWFLGFKASWFQSVLVSTFLGSKVSWFLAFKFSKFQCSKCQ